MSQALSKWKGWQVIGVDLIASKRSILEELLAIKTEPTSAARFAIELWSKVDSSIDQKPHAPTDRNEKQKKYCSGEQIRQEYLTRDRLLSTAKLHDANKHLARWYGVISH